jgi:hypothetical protein
MTRSRAAVFVGPSVASVAVADEPDVDRLPPARHGDIDALLARPQPPAVIGIVDGAIFHRTAVSAKEVLRAIDQGITVFGSSGVGALRAVECAPYGMVGIGWIYHEYRSGRIDADDEVAVDIDPRNGQPRSVSMANLRYAIAAAAHKGVATAEHASRFLEIAKALHYPQRTAATVLRALTSEPNGPADCADLARFLAEDAPDAMRDDAIALLDAVRQALRDARGDPR